MTLVLAAGVGEDTLLRFFVALLVLLLSAKVFGHVARRLGQPTVVGELTAGILLGPTLLGRIAPDAATWLFHGDREAAAMISAVAWLGVVVLLAVTGFEIDLGQLRRLGRAAVTTSVSSLAIPLALGLGMGALLPASFAGEAGGGALPLFMGVALGISSLPVVAKVLRELQLAKASVGQVMLAAGMVNDVVGWALLGVVAGMVSSDGSPLRGLAVSLLGALVVIVGGLTIGQRAVDGLLRVVRRSDTDRGSLLGVSVIIVIAAGAVTQALGVEAVLGAFVAGMVLSRSPLGGPSIERPLSQMADHVLAPVFFATAGLQVDLLSIARPPTLWWTLAIIAVAVIAKVVGGGLGSLLGGFGRRDALAIGVGLNARGALEIVVASVGLSLGVLSSEAYSAVVVMAVVTSLMAPPLLTAILGLTPSGPGDAAAQGVLAGARAALLPTRGGASSVLAGRVVDMVLPTTASMTALTVHRPGEEAQAGRLAARSVQSSIRRRLRWRDHVAEDTAAAVLAESVLGYDLIALGATSAQMQQGIVSPVLARIVSSATVPVVVLRSVDQVDPAEVSLDRIAVGVTGTGSGEVAAELAIRLATAQGARLSLIHIIDRPGPGDPREGADGAAFRMQARSLADADDVLAEPRHVAEGNGVDVAVMMRRSRTVAEELIQAAEEAAATLLVIGAERRADGSFLGHTVSHLLARAPMSVAVVVSSGRTDAPAH